MSELPNEILWVFAILFLILCPLALGLIVRGSRRGETATSAQRRRALVAAMLVLGGLVVTGWPFCELMLWPLIDWLSG